MISHVMLDNSAHVDREVRLPADTKLTDLNWNRTEEAVFYSNQLGDLREGEHPRTKLAEQTKSLPAMTRLHSELALQQVPLATGNALTTWIEIPFRFNRKAPIEIISKPAAKTGLGIEPLGS